jgi:fatty-acyl-CoA synthase
MNSIAVIKSSCLIVLLTPAPVISTSTPDWSTRKLGCVGVIISGLDCRIVDPQTLEDVPSGQEGEVCGYCDFFTIVLIRKYATQIVCSGPSVMVGYHNNQKANDEVFYEKHGKRFFRTGDLGKFEDGKVCRLPCPFGLMLSFARCSF